VHSKTDPYLPLPSSLFFLMSILMVSSRSGTTATAGTCPSMESKWLQTFFFLNSSPCYH
jgi:hypothetical protein